jgi:hypothetical protein
MTKRSPKPRCGRCPECGSENVKKIAYGLPAPDVHWPDDVVMGGCCITGNDPTRHCGECGHEWGRPHPLPEGETDTDEPL